MNGAAFFFSSKSRNQSQTNFNGRLTKKKKKEKIQIIDRAENTQKSRLVGGDLLPARSKGEK